MRSFHAIVTRDAESIRRFASNAFARKTLSIEQLNEVEKILIDLQKISESSKKIHLEMYPNEDQEEEEERQRLGKRPVGRPSGTTKDFLEKRRKEELAKVV